ncbi:mechanosensitive ion channel family protein [Francisella adeliensis]|uniref:Mechanosensitive ion channel n=1 Tax=Francisella adeliensis TaxID=2007306 RepID=A0A2Z4XZQ5_9GAMM|nr:mechanosensitive ion channel domain-containing protein [Francisella adeliensis]AXA34128.1 mechanosensitive ion channel protein MscS [Francisella adeliensis]MBK2085296.1 mechanosensitive ion channel [Francisella adeliensis]MBK2095936.1 mechanosensitive ion channel [Francisella adeliensis]QIW12370.1 mechanosensitive ion channel [Francisella adeliensis]QIW14244.1 mechanosensitive ion channel [Francisella adeliensis]
MNALNDILLRVQNLHPFQIILIDLLICLMVGLIIYIIGHIFTAKHKNTIKFCFIKSFKLTLYLIITVYFIKTCIDLFVIVQLPNYKEIVISYTDKIFDFCVYIAIIISLFRFIKKSKMMLIEKKKQETIGGYEDYRDINAVFKALELIGICLSVILILAALRVPPTALGAFSGVAIAGLTLSQSTILTNFFGGLFVIFNRKYSEGDMVASDINSSIKFQGKIKKIGTLTTQIDSYETAPMHIPNSVFLNTCITNFARRTHRRILQNITVDYKHLDDISMIKEEIYKILKSHPKLDPNMKTLVSLCPSGTVIGNRTEGSFGDRGVNIQIYAMTAYVLNADFREIQDDIFIQIAQSLNVKNISFAINPTTLIKEL